MLVNTMIYSVGKRIFVLADWPKIRGRTQNGALFPIKESIGFGAVSGSDWNTKGVHKAPLSSLL